LRVAVIGAGNMGKNHIRNYALLPGAELLAVSDVDLSARKIAKSYKAAYYKDYKKMIDEVKPDAVSIVVPTPYHYEVGAYCLNNGVHCLIEKPFASTLKQADQLIGLAEQNGKVLTVGHIERFNPLVVKIKELIDQKKLGKITSIICQRVGGFPAVEPKSDVIIDLAVHDIDIINYLLQRFPDKISSHGSRTHHSKEIDSAEILLDYGNASGFIHANWLTPVKVRTITITGSHGYVEGNYITQELVYHRHNMSETGNEFSKFVSNLGNSVKEMIKIDFKEPLAAELENFIEAVKGTHIADLVNPIDAREALRLALQAVEPYREEVT
jgi:UDP-N-acetylglucosamine 3-dehydrogenase